MELPTYRDVFNQLKEWERLKVGNETELTPIERMIYNHEPAGKEEENFRNDLKNVMLWVEDQVRREYEPVTSPDNEQLYKNVEQAIAQLLEDDNVDVQQQISNVEALMDDLANMLETLEAEAEDFQPDSGAFTPMNNERPSREGLSFTVHGVSCDDLSSLA